MAEGIELVQCTAARAATDPALWPELLWQVGRLIGSDMNLVEHVDKRTGAVSVGFTDRPDIIAAARDDYERHFFAINPRFDAAQALPPGAVHDDDRVGDDKFLDSTEYYVDLLAPRGLKYFIGSDIADDSEQRVILSLQRAPDRGRVTDADRAVLKRVLPDLRNAMAMYLRLTRGPASGTLAAVLDRLIDPLAVLQADGRVRFANQAMTGLLAAGDLLVLRDSRIAGLSESVQAGLARALRTGLGLGKSASSVASACAGPLIFRIVPLGSDQSRAFGDRHEQLFCLLIDDPARPNWPVVDEAMRLFGLTRREATVGAHIAGGLTVDEIAQRLGVSRNTVRTHLAMLREKIGVRSALAVAAAMRRAIVPLA